MITCNGEYIGGEAETLLDSVEGDDREAILIAMSIAAETSLHQ